MSFFPTPDDEVPGVTAQQNRDGTTTYRTVPTAAPTPAPAPSERVSGGVSRWTAGAPPASPPTEAPAGPSARVYRGASRYIAGGEVESIDHARHVQGSEPAQSSSILGTARNAAGSATGRIDDRVTVELEPGNPASRTSIKTALRQGLVRRGADGTFYEGAAPDRSAVVPSSQQQQQQQQGDQQQTPDADAFKPDPDAVMSFNAMVENVPQPVLDAATANAIAAVASGDPESWARAQRHLASSGMDPAGASEAAQRAYDMFESQVARAVAPVIGGVEVEQRLAFYEWAQRSAGRELQEATTKLVYEGSLAGFKSLAARYARSRG